MFRKARPFNTKKKNIHLIKRSSFLKLLKLAPPARSFDEAFFAGQAVQSSSGNRRCPEKQQHYLITNYHLTLIFEQTINTAMLLVKCHVTSHVRGFVGGYETISPNPICLKSAKKVSRIIWTASLLFEFIVYIRSRHLITEGPQAH